jgi:diguanylate cyclase (GGDEF)-like protein
MQTHPYHTISLQTLVVTILALLIGALAVFGWSMHSAWQRWQKTDRLTQSMQRTSNGLRLAFAQYDGVLNMEVGLDPDSHASASLKRTTFQEISRDHQAFVTAYQQDVTTMRGTALSATLQTIGTDFFRYQSFAAQVTHDMQHHRYHAALYLQDVGNAAVTQAMNRALRRLNAEVIMLTSTQAADLHRRLAHTTELLAGLGLMVLGITTLGLMSFRRSTRALVNKLEMAAQGRFTETTRVEIWNDYLPVHRAFRDMRQALSEALMTLVTVIQNQETLITARTKTAQHAALRLQDVLRFITETMQDWHRADIFAHISQEFLRTIRARGWASFNAETFAANGRGGIVPEGFAQMPGPLQETLRAKTTPLPLILPGELIEAHVFSWRPYHLGRSFLVIFCDVLSSPDEVEDMIVELAIMQLENMWSEVWLFQETERQAKQDALTQLGNRREFESRLGAKILPGSQNPIPFQLMLVDIDHLKTINDTQGHQAGDEALKRVADALKQVTSETVEAFRIGGDEFALLLDGVEDSAHPDDVRRRIQMVLPEALTLSFGVAQHPTMGLSAHVLFMTADWALYEAKKRGRHQLHFARLVDMLAELCRHPATETAKVIAAWLDDRLEWPRDTTLTLAEETRALAAELGCSFEEQQRLWIAAILHDLGQLLKRPLTGYSGGFEQRQEYAVTAAEFLAPYPDLAPIALAIRHHSDRWDGQGSWQGLKGSDIPLPSRIMAVVDHGFWIARELQTASQDDVNKILEAESGTCLDPHLVSVWIQVHHAKALSGSEEIRTTLSREKENNDLAK